MGKILRSALVAVLVASGSLAAAAAHADVNNASASNVQNGQNTSSSSQSGKGKTGSAVGGQVSGVVSGGRASVDAHNTSKDSSVRSGDTKGTNSVAAFVGLNTNGDGGVVISDVVNSCRTGECENIQNGSNRYSLSQTLSAVTGDGVAGQIIGLVAARRTEPSIVASNTSDGVDVTTGDARGTNDSSAFVGLNSSDAGPAISASDLSGLCTRSDCANLQDGSNRISSRQSVDTHSGEGVGGQVIGAITNSPTSIDARNTTTDSTVDTGDANGQNSAAFFAGLNTSETGPTITASDVKNSCNGAGCDNVQDGNNRVSSDQATNSTSGVGIAGQVIGAASLGGTISVVAANTTKNSDVTTGHADATNDLAAFVGLNSSGSPVITSDITGSCNGKEECPNVQNGGNRLTGSQTAHAATGDGVAGQILGLASGGSASLDATNLSVDDTVQTGDANAHNAASTFVGLNVSDGGPTVTAADISGATATNLQDGANSKTLTQAADASSGNGVAGQESEIVTAAGGSARAILANASTNVDSSSGASNFSNEDSQFVGLNVSSSTLIG